MLPHSSALISLASREALMMQASRAVSSKFPRPKPRHYKRRLFESAVAPELPRTIKQCESPYGRYLEAKAEIAKYEDYEIALANLVRNWMKNNEFRVLAVCQFTTVPGRTLHLCKNQLRTKGVEFRSYGNKIMRKVFEGTPLSSLEPVFVGHNAIILGKTPESLVTIQKECAKLNFLVPLVYVLDGRIVSTREVDSLATLPSLDCLYAETTQILDRAVRLLPQNLDAIPHGLVNSLSHLESRGGEEPQAAK